MTATKCKGNFPDVRRSNTCQLATFTLDYYLFFKDKHNSYTVNKQTLIQPENISV